MGRRRLRWTRWVRRARRGAAIRRYLAEAAEPRLNLGCGPHCVPGWLNADKFAPEADVYLDVEEPFPFADAQFELVYSEHMLEHVPVDAVPGVLHEIHRVVRPGGVCRITVPDLELHARRYVEGDRAFSDAILRSFDAKRERRPEKYWLVRSPGGAFMSRACSRFYGHQWMYDFETLGSCLEEVGFTKVEKCRFGESLSPHAAALDLEERVFETLYVDAVR